MPAASTLLDKLRELITHDGTPAAERRSALERLERLIAGHDGTGMPPTRITRSARIGHRRRALHLDELARLDPFTDQLSFADCIAAIARACAAHGVMPSVIDFGCRNEHQPVVAAGFLIEEAPNVVAFAAAIAEALPGTGVNLAEHSGPGERRFLLYLPGKVLDFEEA
jgi:hypothetical protein